MISVTVTNSLDEGTSLHWHGENILVYLGAHMLTAGRLAAKSHSMVRWSTFYHAVSNRSWQVVHIRLPGRSIWHKLVPQPRQYGRLNNFSRLLSLTLH
jgi:hypothetical protein